MRNKIACLLSTLVLLFGCKKNVDTSPPPTAYFSAKSAFHSTISSIGTTLVIGTYDTVILVNNSLNADSIIWNCGNKIISTNNTAGIKFDSAGTYTITLTAISKSGKKNIASLNVIAKERVLKNFSIDKLALNSFSPSQNGLPVFTKLDLWIVLKNSISSSNIITSNGDFDVPIIYQSPVFQNIDSAFHSSIKYSIPSTLKVALNCPIMYPDGIQSKGLGLILNLYGKDQSGTYLLASSRWNGVGFMMTDLTGGNPSLSNSFGLITPVAGSPTSITLNFLYQ
ncbi:MAG: hypothetical protein U9R46_06460 [Bacteroidota bacterium]|nr:hypothetical protein [Bacteroidota bacterium]